jgi:hypothetical protein
MHFKSFLNTLFYSPDAIIFMIIFGVYVAIALFIVLIVYTPQLRDFFLSFNGIHGTFYSPAATMFALIAAFMGASLVSSFNAHTESINQERTALLLYVDFINNTPPLANQNLQYQVKNYLQSALEEEWPLLEHQKISRSTGEAFQEIFLKTIKIAPVLEGTQAGRELAKTLDAWYEARAKRISFRWKHVEHLRWGVLLMLAFLLQISVAATHLASSKKAMGLSMGITTALIISVMTPLALNVNHYSGLLQVSKMPLEEVYEILSEQFSNDR